jgi:hypothetical protein
MPAVGDQLLVVRVDVARGHARAGVVPDHRDGDRRRGEAGVGLLAREQLPEDDAESVDVGQHVVDVGLLGQDLGRHPVDAALLLLLGVLLEVALEAGEAEVAHLQVPLGVEQQVERLEVAVHDARRVEEVHALGRLQRQPHLQRQWNVGNQLVVDQLHAYEVVLIS